MFLELTVSNNVTQISYKGSMGKLLLISIHIGVIVAGMIFIAVSLFADNGPKEFLYFGGFFSFFGILGVLNYPQQVRKMGTPAPFTANLRGIKFNHRPFEPDKAKEVLWPQVSKVVLTRTFTLKHWIWFSYKPRYSLILFFNDKEYGKSNLLKKDEYNIFISPEGQRYTTLKYPKGLDKELQVALANISPNGCSIFSYKKTTFDHRRKTEEYVS